MTNTNEKLIEKIKILRFKTGISFIECKKALIETNLNIEEAILYLRKTGTLNAIKRNDKTALEGLITSYINEEKNKAVIMEINCETDFVSKSDEFKNFCDKISKYFLYENTNENLNLKKNDILLPDLLDNEKINIISKFKENIIINRLIKITSHDNQIFGYSHGSLHHGKIASLIIIKKHTDAVDEIMKDISMQIVAMKAKYLTINSISENIIENEKNIIIENTNLNYKNKTAEQIENIIQNNIKKFYQEVVLMEQTFIKNQNFKIKDLVNNNNIEIKNFIRFEVGEESNLC
ncbi:MAG TPA: translation elongation factor Ts [Candidatus Azoamicus sp.]